MKINTVKEAVKYNCKSLGISEPQIRFFPASHFATPTTMAALSRDGAILDINSECGRTEADIWFAISHELRHKWQIDRDYDFASYKTSNEINIVDYNMQPAEIDAHAWAVIVMVSTFGLRPMLREVLGEEVWTAIKCRMQEIFKIEE